MVQASQTSLRALDVTKEGFVAIQLCVGGNNELIRFLSHAIGERQAMIVSTPRVTELYTRDITDRLVAAGQRASLFVGLFDEGTKKLNAVEGICNEYYSRELDRKSVLVAIGGGVCSDLVTVAASWIRRGISHIRVPTTLIGQIDAAIGIKGAVNFRNKKSALGSYYAPEYVLVHPAFLSTLPQAHLRAGLAEAVKIAVVSDADLFYLLQQHGRELLEARFTSKQHVGVQLIWQSAIRMIEQLQPNLYEKKSLERLVDFGHTFSPAVESRSEFTMLHGEAVAIDIALSTVIGNSLRLISDPDCYSILNLLRMLGLPLNCDLLDYQTAVASLEDAKRHRGGVVNLVVPVQIGEAAFIKDIDVVKDVLDTSLRVLKRQSLHQVCKLSHTVGI